jgi:AcrR family transcriptional regulator
MGEEVRRLLLDTTRRLLVADGYQALSMRRIAQEAGYSATTIYLHFENKDALIHALIEEGMAKLYTALESAAGSAAGEAKLRSISRAYIDFGRSNPEYYEIMFMLHSDRMQRFPAEKYRRARRSLEVIAFALEARDDDSGTEDVRVAATAVWASLHGVVSLLLASRVDSSIDPDALILAVENQIAGAREPVRAHSSRETTFIRKQNTIPYRR